MIEQNTESKTKSFTYDGMPELDVQEKPISFFEFWPTWIMYFPVFLQWLWLSLKSFSFTLPLIANPRIPLSGMVGVPKSTMFLSAEKDMSESVLSWCLYQKTSKKVDDQVEQFVNTMHKHGLDFPVVCKPDIGSRGAGVKKISNTGEVLSYLVRFPIGADVFIQQLAENEAEAGVFFVRHPDDKIGRIVSLTLKYMPYVVGDGEKTLEQLISEDARASIKPELYKNRFRYQWQQIVAEGEKVNLVFSASHCRGAVFKNGQQFITPELTRQINQYMSCFPEFYYGRLDLKFKDIESLMLGNNIEIIEINGASAELLHIWDSRTKFKEAIHALIWQYRTLFSLGKINKAKGYKPPGMIALIRAWRREKAITGIYPTNE